MISNLSHSFTVNQVDFTKKTDCYVNIQKKKELVQFRSASNSNNVNLSFIQSEDINSSTSLSIVDRSTSLIQNKVYIELEDQILESVSGFTIESDIFFLTDVFTVDLITQRKIPLFFQHNLSRVLTGSETYNDIKIVDQSFEPILTSRYLVDINEGIVYSNLQNTFDPITGLFEVFYVTYTVKKSSGVLERYTEILNNSKVFDVAQLEDIDPDTSTIIPGHKVYLVQEDIGESFNITLPSISDYGLRRASSSRIEILDPEATSTENPWFVRVRSGKFISAGVTGIKKYYVSEFDAQSFSPYLPYKQTDETSYRVSKRIIKTLKDKIALSFSELLFPEVFVIKADGSFKFALTANPARVGTQALASGTYFSKVLLGSSKVAGTGLNAEVDPVSGSSIDSYGGFIVLPAGYEIAETDVIRTIYTYSETDYEITLFDFNPLSSVELLDERVAFVIRPEPLGSTLEKTLYYLVVNEDGMVTESDINFPLAGLSDTVENLILTSGLWYDRDPETVSWVTTGLNFIRECTVEGENNQDDILVLGDIYVREAISPNSLVLNDVRVRGGGIREEEVQTSIELNPEVQWHWDIALWDGKPFPAAASIFVDIPIDVLTTADGNLTPENVTEIVHKHIAQGVYPVIHGYNIYQTTITGLDLTSSGLITLYWHSGPPDSLFDIYTSASEDGNYELFINGLSDTKYTFSGIPQKYYTVLGYPSGVSHAFLDGSIFEIQKIEL